MKWFNNLTISAKLTVTFLFILILTTILGVFSLRELSKVNQAGVTTSTYLVPALRDAAQLQSAILRIRIAHLVVSNQVIDEGMGDPRQYLNKQVASTRALLESLRGRLVTEEGKARLASIETKLGNLLALNDEAFKAIDEFQTLKGFAILDNQIPVPTRELMNDVQSLNDHLTERAATIQASSSITYEAAQRWIIVLLVIAFAASIFLGIFISRAIAGPIRRAVAVAQNVAKGDLTDDIVTDRKDETGQLLQALQTMNGNLQQIVLKIRQGTDVISTATGEIAAGNLDLSSRTEQQASSLEETASAMEELTTTVKQNADNARQANQLAVSASEVAVKGGNVVAQVVTTMESIHGSSKKIVDIISVIDGIAFQTNILALNAAVEAARAGEQGRGFAVVASEVRSLAQRSATAAKEIKTLIDDSVSKVAAGSNLVGQAGTTMTEVVASIQRVSDIVGEITAASQEQSAGIEEVNGAITQMDEVTQQNAALVEEGAAATKSMQHQAQDLSEAVKVFKVAHDAGVTPTTWAPASQSPKPRPPVDVTPPKAALSTDKQPARTPAKTPASTHTPKRLPATVTDKPDDWEEF
jgi:methyl-accepting chemotaxis protein